MEFTVNGMSCGHCVRSVTSAIQQLDPSAVLSVDLDAKSVTVQSATANEAAIAAAITEAGYAVEGAHA